MNRALTWRTLGVAVGVVLVAAFLSLVSGNMGMASAMFVVAALEGTLGAITIALVRSRQKGNHPSAL
jgi:hypothetical protein